MPNNYKLPPSPSRCASGVLRLFVRSGLIVADDAREMLARENRGFSLNAALRVGAHDRVGLERLV